MFQQVNTIIAHIAQQLLNPLHSQWRRLGAAILPTVDGGEGDAELGGEFLLGKTRSLPKLTD